MSPTSFSLGASAVKSRATRSRNVVLGVVGGGEAVPPGSRLAGLQAKLTHQRPDQLGSAVDTVVGQVGVNAPVTVGAVGCLEEMDDEFLELCTPAGGGGFGFVPPVVIPGSGYACPQAHLHD